MRLSTTLVAVLAAVVLYCVHAYLKSSIWELLSGTSSRSKERACLVLLSSAPTEFSGYTKIVGTIRNNCEQKFVHVSVEFISGPAESASTSEGAGKRVQVMTALAGELAPGAQREISTKLFVPVGPFSYHVGKIEAF